jgi:hypothetical protein
MEKMEIVRELDYEPIRVTQRDIDDLLHRLLKPHL